MDPFNEANEIELKVYEALKNILDPEIGINIVDLGLIYKIEYKAPEEITIEMTFSTKACPMSEVILKNIDHEMKSVFPDKKVSVLIVWEPEWNTEFVTEEGRKALGMN